MDAPSYLFSPFHVPNHMTSSLSWNIDVTELLLSPVLLFIWMNPSGTDACDGIVYSMYAAADMMKVLMPIPAVFLWLEDKDS